METVELKRCPFCGGEAFIVKERDGEWYKEWYSVKCNDCEAKIEGDCCFMCGRERPSEEEMRQIEKELAEKWNRRAYDERNNE